MLSSPVFSAAAPSPKRIILDPGSGHKCMSILKPWANDHYYHIDHFGSDHELLKKQEIKSFFSIILILNGKNVFMCFIILSNSLQDQTYLYMYTMHGEVWIQWFKTQSSKKCISLHEVWTWSDHWFNSIGSQLSQENVISARPRSDSHLTANQCFKTNSSNFLFT